MVDDTAENEAPTRREYVKYGGAVIGGGLLAGCTGSSSGSGGNNSSGAGGENTSAGSGSNSSDDSQTDNQTTGSSGNSYSVTMSPMGEVTFEVVPQNVYAGQPNTVDMAIAAGQADALNSMYYPEENATLLNNFYERLDGVSLEWKNLANAWNMGKERFYELGSDVHLIDPAYASTLDNLNRSDVKEIGNQIGPWFGNYYSGSHGNPPDAWAEEYQYYSLWQIFANIAQVLGAENRGAALKDVHSSMLSTIKSKLPKNKNRPTVALTFPGKKETFWIYHLNADGFLTAHTRPLGAKDAFADVQIPGAQKQVDYEAMLNADPDSILVLFTMGSSYSITDIRKSLTSNAVGKELSAVKNDRVYAQGVRYQGPITNLFQTEMTAKQLYPDQFGQWPGYKDGKPYPKIPKKEQLFDRQRVTDIIKGEF